MKKILIAAAVILAVGTTATQADMMDDLNFNVKGGVNYSQFTAAEGVTPGYDLGFSAGAGASCPMGDDLSLSVDVLYSMKNGKLTTGAIETKQATSWIELPIMLNYNVSPEFTISGGGYAAYLMSANVTASSVELDTKELHESLDYGVSICGSYNLDDITISAGYALGLADIIKGDGESKTSNISGSVAYNF